MITKEYILQYAEEKDGGLSLTVYSKVFNEQVSFKIFPDDDGITERIVEIANDLMDLEPSALVTIRETVWKAFNRYGELVDYTLYEDTERYGKGQISRDELNEINRRRQQELYDIYSEQDCWETIGKPEYGTCLFPDIWKHRFGLITFYPEWEQEGLNIIVRNGVIIGYGQHITSEYDDPNLKSVYELWR